MAASESAMRQVEIFTDGSCLGNPGPGGYGIIVRENGHDTELSAGYALTTNNRMELLAVIKALEELSGHCALTLVTDSSYVVKGMTEYLPNWQKRHWRSSTGGPVKNQDLWRRLVSACEGHKITWQWIRGHAGHRANERCDELARTAAQTKPLLRDEGYRS